LLGLILIVVFEKGSSLEFINKYNKTFGDESTVVAVNLLNGCILQIKGIKILPVPFEKAIKFGNQGNEKSDFVFLPGVF
jgi:hypothetical protein